MMTQYVAFLRGINVGGNNLISMSALRSALDQAGYQDARTYIQSGNILFSGHETSAIKLSQQIQELIVKTFKLTIDVVVFSKADWQEIVSSAPKWWGQNADWKHNILILLPPLAAAEAVGDIGELKPNIELVSAGAGVVYQSVSFKDFGKATTGKLASNKLYKQMTVRNYNTATKLGRLLEV